MISERIKDLAKSGAQRGRENPLTHFNRDYHYAALNLYADLPLWEKLARSMAYAIESQEVWAYAEDGIGGRIYYFNEAPIEEICPDLNFDREAKERINKNG